MAEETTTTSTGRSPKWNSVDPFEVEFGDSNCRNQAINTFKIRVRGAWSVGTLATRPEGARDIGAAMGNVPAHPGQRLIVNPAKMVAIVYDPLEEDEALRKKLSHALKRANRVSADITFVDKQELKLTPALCKTLCHEMLRKQTSGSITVTKGKLPSAAQLESLPGDELYDPWNSNTRKPRFKKDVEEYERGLEQIR